MTFLFNVCLPFKSRSLFKLYLLFKLRFRVYVSRIGYACCVFLLFKLRLFKLGFRVYVSCISYACCAFLLFKLRLFTLVV